MQPLSSSTGPALPRERLLACYQQALGHDLPNKLVALQGLARLLGEELEGQLSGDALECLQRVVGLTREVHEQVSALAELGRACREGGLATAADLKALWAEVSAETILQTPGRAIVFECTEPLPAPVLPGRAARRVLLELVRHAIRRTPAPQPLRLRLACRVSPEGTHLELHDDGPSPSAAYLEKAFEPRLDGREEPGLGLFLARLLAEGWGGTIQLSAPSEGGCLASLQIPQRGDVRTKDA